jgi:hypothetical protein
MTGRKLILFIPENLDLVNIFKEHGYHDLIAHLDKCHYFISTMINILEIYKDMGNSYAQISSKRIEKVLTWRFSPKIQNALIDCGIIECKKSYSVNKFSKGYRFTELYRKSILKKVNISDIRFERKVISLKNKDSANLNALQLKLYKKLEQIEIDYENALRYIRTLLEEKKYSIPQYNTRLCWIEKIHKKDILFTESKKTGRIFTSITLLPKDIRRRFLRYAHDGLCEIDISNAQPIIFNYIIYQHFDIDINVLEQIYFPYHYVKRFNSKSLFIPDAPHYLLLSLLSYVPTITDSTPPEDVLKYTELTLRGKLYEYLIESYIQQTGKKINRDDFKIKMMILFNAKRNWDTAEKRIFTEKFPNVWRVIKEIKKDDHKNLAIQLHKLESDLIINTVAKRILREQPSIALYTIHDCILTSRDNVDYVRQVIFDESKRLYGIAPKLKIKYPEYEYLNNP